MDITSRLYWPEVSAVELAAIIENQRATLLALEDKTQALVLEHRKMVMRNTVLMEDRDRLAGVLHDTRIWANGLEAQNNRMRKRGFRAWRRKYFPGLSNLGKRLRGKGAK